LLRRRGGDLRQDRAGGRVRQDGGQGGGVCVRALGDGVVAAGRAYRPAPTAPGDHFGAAVAISGKIGLVGAYGKVNETGPAYAFARSGTAWPQQAALTAAGLPDDSFGAAVAISGTTAVVGAPGKMVGTGAAYAFVRSGTVWSQQAELTASDAAVGNGF